MKVQIFPGKDGQWYCRLVAHNGETVLTSEGYTRKWNAKRAAKSFARFSSALTIEEVNE